MTLDGTLVLVAAAIFFAGFVKGATGMGPKTHTQTPDSPEPKSP